MAGKILLYGFEELGDILAVKAVAGPFLAEVLPVWKEDYGKPVGALAGRKTRAAHGSVFSGKLAGRMMVFCDMDQQVEAILPALRQAGIGVECYKAVLTVHNQEWDGVHLLAELQKERRAIEAQREKK